MLLDINVLRFPTVFAHDVPRGLEERTDRLGGGAGSGRFGYHESALEIR